MEKDLQARVITLAEGFGWMVYHTYDSRRCNPGFPDLVLVKGDTCLFVELKREQGYLRAAQETWLEALRKVTRVDAFVVRPSRYDALRAALMTLGVKE